MSEQEMAYIGQKPCGCLTFAAVISERNNSLAAKEAAKSIKKGETVTKVTVEHVRSMSFRCDEHKARGTAATAQRPTR